jgi:hypothetical protein
LAPFGLGGVMILSQCNLLFSWNLVGAFTHARPDECNLPIRILRHLIVTGELRPRTAPMSRRQGPAFTGCTGFAACLRAARCPTESTGRSD